MLGAQGQLFGSFRVASADDACQLAVGAAVADDPGGLCQNQHHLIAAIGKGLVQGDGIAQSAVIIGDTINHNGLAGHRDTAGGHQHAVVVLVQITACKVFRLASGCIGGNHVPFRRVCVHFCKVQWVFAARIAERPIDILQVQKRAAVQHVARAHVLLAHRVFLIKQVVSPVLAAYIGCEVCTASRNADAIIKLYIVFHTPVKHARRINAAQAAAYVDHANFCHLLLPPLMQQIIHLSHAQSIIQSGADARNFVLLGHSYFNRTPPQLPPPFPVRGQFGAGPCWGCPAAY